MEHDDSRSVIMSEVMTPEKANFTGNIHGGYLLSLLDRVAYACAARYSGRYVVTLSVDQVIFKQPIHVGELVSCYARINHVGHTSMVVGIKVVAENLQNHTKRHTNSCFFTMIAVDEQGKPIEVEPLALRNATEKRRFEEAVLRKEMSRKYAQEHKQRKDELRKKMDSK